MVLMGLHDEEQRARDWVEKRLDFDRDGEYNTFEVCVCFRCLIKPLTHRSSNQTTIRVLGGLLSAHYLTNATIYLERAVELGDRLMPVFDSPSGVPWSMVNLGQRKGIPDRDNNGLSSTAEAGTLQLEFKYLSYLTDDDTYWRAAEKVVLNP
jgi:endoplasmic reticulum Man9GlcNAc2 1,2-alpha-mannosidase